MKYLSLPCLFSLSITIPEKLDYFINKYAEHSHDKWCMEKVKCMFTSMHPLHLPPSASLPPFLFFSLSLSCCWDICKTLGNESC